MMPIHEIHLIAIKLSYKMKTKRKRKYPNRNKLGTLTTFREFFDEEMRLKRSLRLPI